MSRRGCHILDVKKCSCNFCAKTMGNRILRGIDEARRRGESVSNNNPHLLVPEPDNGHPVQGVGRTCDIPEISNTEAPGPGRGLPLDGDRASG